jgi:hypothetical protein
MRIKMDVNDFDGRPDTPVQPRAAVETNDANRAVGFLYENLRSLHVSKKDFPNIANDRVFEPVVSNTKLGEVMKRYDGERCNGFLGRYYDEAFKENTNSLVLMHADCANISQKERNVFALEIVENSPHERLMDLYKERGLYTVFVFSKDDYDAYLTYLHTSGLVRPLCPQTEFLF